MRLPPFGGYRYQVIDLTTSADGIIGRRRRARKEMRTLRYKWTSKLRSLASRATLAGVGCIVGLALPAADAPGVPAPVSGLGVPIVAAQAPPVSPPPVPTPAASPPPVPTPRVTPPPVPTPSVSPPVPTPPVSPPPAQVVPGAPGNVPGMTSPLDPGQAPSEGSTDSSAPGATDGGTPGGSARPGTAGTTTTRRTSAPAGGASGPRTPADARSLSAPDPLRPNAFSCISLGSRIETCEGPAGPLVCIQGDAAPLDCQSTMPAATGYPFSLPVVGALLTLIGFVVSRPLPKAVAGWAGGWRRRLASRFGVRAASQD